MLFQELIQQHNHNHFFGRGNREKRKERKSHKLSVNAIFYKLPRLREARAKGCETTAAVVAAAVATDSCLICPSSLSLAALIPQVPLATERERERESCGTVRSGHDDDEDDDDGQRHCDVLTLVLQFLRSSVPLSLA